MYKANQSQQNNRDKNTNIKQTDYRETTQMYQGYIFIISLQAALTRNQLEHSKLVIIALK